MVIIRKICFSFFSFFSFFPCWLCVNKNKEIFFQTSAPLSSSHFHLHQQTLSRNNFSSLSNKGWCWITVGEKKRMSLFMVLRGVYSFNTFFSFSTAAAPPVVIICLLGKKSQLMTRRRQGPQILMVDVRRKVNLHFYCAEGVKWVG